MHARLREYPDLHVYHYAAYEITALKRLMGRYGTREARARRPAPPRASSSTCSRVVRNGLRTSRPGYGLKEMEAFLDFERQAEVKDGGTSIVIFEQWMQTRRALAAATRSTSTTARTASRRVCCATGCSS